MSLLEEPERDLRTRRAREIRQESITGGQKGTKPCRLDLIPPEALWEIGLVYGYGAQKYDDNNWRKGYPRHLSMAAAMRHLELYRMGQDEDEESGLSHLAHAAFHLMAMLTHDADPSTYEEFDDRVQLAPEIVRNLSDRTYYD